MKTNKIKTTSKEITINQITLPINQNLTEDEMKLVPPEQNLITDINIIESLALAVKLNIPALLVGETGTGKTSIIKQLAHLTKTPLLRINLNGNTTVDELVGKTLINKDGTYFCDGVLTTALRHGYWILIDEINAALPEINIALNSVLERSDEGKLGNLTLAEKDNEIIVPHPRFRAFATMNPSHSGNYAGVSELNRATASRFGVTLEIQPLSKTSEREVIQHKLKIHTNQKTITKEQKEIIDVLLNVAEEMRKAYNDGTGSFYYSTRDIIQTVIINHHFGNIHKALESSIYGKCIPEDKNAIKALVKMYVDNDGKPVQNKTQKTEEEKETETEETEETETV